ncbi:hypothetical protein Poli38472_004016 [Pythium oligandrum]|uniref:Uncharacterized protein n=1 Tax=Pythium oligandrum TaxID=41045 RepID=A0A8K1CP98_PYTOL|nr:hypothetical protein Poli38472_004016 [Pythium oligandrum]|eukprot:TMW66251.1 hypothetical protein Poli38472_004016 [Pythium oligandrum]
MGSGASTVARPLGVDAEDEVTLDDVCEWLKTQDAGDVGETIAKRCRESGLSAAEVLFHMDQDTLLSTLDFSLTDVDRKHAFALFQSGRNALRREYVVSLKELPDAMDKAVYVLERFPMVLDPSGQATRFLKYQRSAVLMAGNPGDMEPECLRRHLVGALLHGTWLIIDFDKMSTVELEQFFQEGFFPREVLSRSALCRADVIAKLVRPEYGDPDPAQFMVNDQFKFIVLCRGDHPPPKTALSMCVLRVDMNHVKRAEDDERSGENDLLAKALGVTKEVKRNSLQLVEAAFDNDMDTVKKWLDQIYDIESADGHGHTALSEAACQGHNELVTFLLEHGADPNKISDDKRSPLYRASYNGHVETVRLLLESGCDPRTASKQSETAFDAAKTPEVQQVLQQWDLNKTDKLLEARRKVIELKWQERISNHVERERFALMKLHEEIIEIARQGETEALEARFEQLVDDSLSTGEKPRASADVRDDKGSTLLSLAAQHDHVDLVTMLLTKWKVWKELAQENVTSAASAQRELGHKQEMMAKILKANVNARDCRGWTPVAIAVFHEAKRSLFVLLENGADPRLKNQYNKNAFDFAKDDIDAALNVVKSRAEIRQVLIDWENERHGPGDHGASDTTTKETEKGAPENSSNGKKKKSTKSSEMGTKRVTKDSSNGTKPSKPAKAGTKVNGTLMAGLNATTASVAAVDAYFTRKLHVLQLFLLCGYVVMFLLCAILIVYMRHHRSIALSGDATAAHKIILPPFEPLLWIFGAVTGIYSLFFTVVLAVNLYTNEIPKLITEFCYSGRQFVFMVVLVLMLQKSVSIPSLRRSVAIASILSTYTMPIVWFMTRQGVSPHFYVVLTASRALLLLLYTYIFLWPPERASKRTIREYCVFAYIYYGILFTYYHLFHQREYDIGFTVAYVTLVWGSLCPLVIWRVLNADTEYWRGMGQRAVSLQNLFRQKHNIDERISSQGLQVLIEMHRKFIIDFAYLEIKHKIGVGSSAAVFNGLLHSRKPVAIKVYTPSEFSEDTVAEFSQEAALCGALHHPNIVAFHGMCVYPPTICLVSELCQGSLDDVIKSSRRHIQSRIRQQLLLDVAYMLDAARAIAYIHSFSPPFVHRDIKPSNFLVDSNNTVKLTDFGESRSLARNANAPTLNPYMLVASGTSLHRVPGYDASHGSRLMTVCGTVEYMAPEIINGRGGMASYGEAADVYSLAVTMWDILHPGRYKFPTLRHNHLRIFEGVLDGRRPLIDGHVPDRLASVIQSAWHANPQLRPTAQEVVNTLEKIQEEIQALFALHLHDDLARKSNHSAEFSSGAQIVSLMVDAGYVVNNREGTRLGRALMDAGMLHHHHHSKGFHNSDSVYYFDYAAISFSQPLRASCSMLNESGYSSPESDEEDATTASVSEPSKHREARGRLTMDSSMASMANATLDTAFANLTSSTVNGTTPGTPAITPMDPATVAAIEAATRRFRTLQFVMLLGYAVMCSLCVILIAYMRHNRKVALKGDSNAARKIILPAFEPLLWILGLATGTYSLTISLGLLLGWYEMGWPRIVTECYYSGRQFVCLSVIIYMLQKSVTIPALVRTIAITAVLSSYTILVELLLAAYAGEGKTHYVIMMMSRSCLLLIYLYVMIKPPSRASKRTIREYCAFTYGYYGLTLTYNEFYNQGMIDAGTATLYATLVWAAFCPIFVCRVLIADTEYWRGMGQRAVALQRIFRQKHNIDERISSQGLHVLIEMHRKFIIDFAYLEIKNKIGIGSSAVVFNGVLHSRTPVAIKVYTPSEFSEDTVAEFSQEAALCGALHHPNIVTFHGMCVCPPTICLVSELCQGSLDDITRAIATRQQHPHRQQQLLNVAYMLDAARAVAYIHSFSPPFIHRDIKPGNFLIDVDNTVKLTDFGESRSLPSAQMMPPTGGQVTTSFVRTTNVSMDSGAALSQATGRPETNRGSLGMSELAVKMTVKGTVDYMAPEIINGKAGVAQYGEAADVYSLAITMWDVLNPTKEKYPSLKNSHLQIFEYVMEGQRPVIDPSVHTNLREVIESAWHPDPRLRPSAQNIVSILEGVQEELLAVFAADLSDELEQEAMQNKFGEVVNKSFAGQHAIDRMEALCFVNSKSEAVRLGNAMMDAGLLHHLKHDRPFERSDGQYFFDDENINLCQPILGQERDGDAEDDDFDADENVDHVVPLPNMRGSGGFLRGRRGGPASVTSSRPRRKNSSATSARTAGRTMSSRSESTMYDTGICSCRKLGQRLEIPKAPPRRRRFRRHRQKAVSEENLLTAKLLAAETTEIPALLGDFDDFDDFDAVDPEFQVIQEPSQLV